MYDLEKYREKREKVLGIKKRGLSFGSIVIMFSVIIIIGFSAFTLPDMVRWLTSRNFIDAIYRQPNGAAWTELIIPQIKSIQGVEDAVKDKNGQRLVITFDKRITDTEKLDSFFQSEQISVVLLNTMDYHQKLLNEQEEEELEAL